MNLLLVDNDSDTLDELRAVCEAAGHIVTVLHRTDVNQSSGDTFDAAILSGGYWYDDAAEHLEAYRSELAFIHRAAIPILGVCLGMQLMHVAHSGEVPLLDDPQTGLKQITVTQRGQELLGLPATMTVHKNHTRGVLQVEPEFEVLAHSPGHVEIIHHTSKPLLGVQFHPEVGDMTESILLLQALLTAAAHPRR